MLLRLIFYVIIGYLIFRVLKGAFGPTKGLKKEPDGGVIDEMVQDPFCKTYIPLRGSIKRNIKGKGYHFCSKTCADRFESEYDG